MPFINTPGLAKDQDDPLFSKNLFAGIEGLIIDGKILHSFAGAINRQNFQGRQEFNMKRVLKNITPCQRPNGMFEQIGNNGCIQKWIGMIAGK